MKAMRDHLSRAAWLAAMMACMFVTGAATAQETLHRKLDAAQDVRFQKLVRTRKNAAEEIAIFQRVHTEKQKEAAGYDARMMQQFNLDKNTRYQFDAMSNALVRIEQRVSGGRTNLVRSLDRFLKREQAAAYLKEARGKNLVNQQIQVLIQLFREKSLEKDFVTRTLQSEFGIDPAAKYRYDDKTRTILLLRAPGGAAAAGKAAPTAPAKPLSPPAAAGKPAARTPAVAPAPGKK